VVLVCAAAVLLLCCCCAAAVLLLCCCVLQGRHEHEAYTGDRTKESLVAFADSLVPSAGQPHLKHGQLKAAPRTPGCNVAGMGCCCLLDALSCDTVACVTKGLVCGCVRSRPQDQRLVSRRREKAQMAISACQEHHQHLVSHWLLQGPCRKVLNHLLTCIHSLLKTTM
jgi:hypothetical protein